MPSRCTIEPARSRTRLASVAVIATMLSSTLLLAQTAATDVYALARRAVERADWADAERLLRPAADAGSPDSSYLLGYVLFREQRTTDSLAAYTAAARLRQPTPDDLLVVASDYILLKAYADAEHWLRNVTQHSPDNVRAWYLLGRTQYNLDHAADAVTAFDRCLQLHPRDVRAEYNLGLAYEKLDRPDDAEKAYRNAMAWQQGDCVRDPQPSLDLGMLLLSRGQAEQALPQLREAVRLGPKNALAQQELGLAFEALARYTEAVAPLERATELAPAAERPHFFLGRVYRRLGQKQAAAAQFAEAGRLAGSHSEKATPNDSQP